MVNKIQGKLKPVCKRNVILAFPVTPCCRSLVAAGISHFWVYIQVVMCEPVGRTTLQGDPNDRVGDLNDRVTLTFSFL